MNRSRFLAITATTLMFSVAAFGQHGHAMGGGAGSAHAMSHEPTAHSTSGSTSAHGERTMNDKLTSNTKLAGKISGLTGMSATDACSGFKNLGQCVAAAHVSKNLGISFADLKDKMLALNADGTQNTTAKPMSLGKAIQAIDPQADSKTEIKKANQQSQEDTENSGS